LTAVDLRCPDFGLRLSEKQGMKLMGPVGVIGFNCPTVGDAINEMLQYLDFHSPALMYRMDTKIWAGKPTLVSDIALSDSRPRTQIDEGAIGRIYQELKGLTNSEFTPVAVLFQHSPVMPISNYRMRFCAQVLFDQEVNGIVLHPETLGKKVAQANPILHNLAMAYVREASGQLPLDIVSQVKFLIRRSIAGNRFGITDIAQKLHICERTLQRKLKNSGVVFEEIVDSVRQARAEELLTQSTLPMAQIAGSLGYVEQASFSRACQRWFGTTPSKLRRQKVYASTSA
jgi:AraC-like DNA-binding protein